MFFKARQFYVVCWTVACMIMLRENMLSAEFILLAGENASESNQFKDSDYKKHIHKLRSKIPGPDYSVFVRKPFVIIGNEDSKIVQQRADRTVAWAVKMLKQDFFSKDPDDIIDIWLFKDKTSYRKQAKAIFNDTPSTPYGYYSPGHKALIMNISTGGGTLVHEIVHPYIASNFPKCPAWFNEGLASLYEQCGTKNGHINGLINWRLGGLKQAIRSKKLPTFHSLCSTSADEFYHQDLGSHYAQARYLCYYLQEKGLLISFYKQFKKNIKQDPTGYRTLKHILKTEDMAKFQKKWENWILQLR